MFRVSERLYGPSFFVAIYFFLCYFSNCVDLDGGIKLGCQEKLDRMGNADDRRCMSCGSDMETRSSLWVRGCCSFSGFRWVLKVEETTPRVICFIEV